MGLMDEAIRRKRKKELEEDVELEGKLVGDYPLSGAVRKVKRRSGFLNFVRNKRNERQVAVQEIE